MLFEETKKKLKIIAVIHYIVSIIGIIMIILNNNGIIRSPLIAALIQPTWIYYAMWVLYSLLIAIPITVFLFKHR